MIVNMTCNFDVVKLKYQHEGKVDILRTSN